MYLLPFAERLLEFSSALSSLPGQVPTQEVNSAAEENVLAVTPTSAMICCADDAETGHFRQSYHDVLVWLHGLHDQTVQLRDLLTKHPESIQLQREHVPMHWVRSSC